MNAGFSERTFEFCYNAEFCSSNAALLATHPHIPSQRAEKELGYDVEFRIQQGHYTRSLFLQHKVPAFAEVRAGRNAAFFAAHHGPYFRFSVDNDQHNTLCELSRTQGNSFYCSPLFNRGPELEAHFRNRTVCANSLLLDPLDVGDITDHAHHNITYSPAGANPTLHSEVRPFKKSFVGFGDPSLKLKSRHIGETYVKTLSEELIGRTLKSKFRSAVTKRLESATPLEQVQLLLGRVYEVTWLLLP